MVGYVVEMVFVVVKSFVVFVEFVVEVYEFGGVGLYVCFEFVVENV